LEWAWRKRIVHRDLKPENLLVTDQGNVKIADFGIAKLVGPNARDAGLTGEGWAVGTPEYLPPEQAMAQPVDGRTDLYALGCVPYELLSGARPSAGVAAPQALALMHAGTRVPPLESAHPALAAWVARMVELEPAARFANARAARKALKRILDRLYPGWDDDPP